MEVNCAWAITWQAVARFLFVTIKSGHSLLVRSSEKEQDTDGQTE
jgi:hypothetical protein